MTGRFPPSVRAAMQAHLPREPQVLHKALHSNSSRSCYILQDGDRSCMSLQVAA